MKNSIAIAGLLVFVTASATLAQTRVTRVSRSTETVRAGGAPTVVTLTGEGFGSVTGARLLRAGRPVRDVNVALAEPVSGRRTTTRLTLELTAGTQALPGTYQLELVTDGQRVLVPISVVVSSGSRLRPGPGRPPIARATADLVVTDCRLDPGPNSLTGRVTIRNAGQMTVSFTNRQTFASARFSSSPTPSRYFGTSEIAPGEVRTIVRRIYTTPTPKPTVTWVVDPDNVVVESNEANNEITCGLAADTPPAPGTPVPDVVITALAAQPTTGTPDTRFTFTVTVRNAGTGAVPPTTSVEIRCTVDGQRPTSTSMMGLAPGETVTRNISIAGNLTVGSKVFECIADPLRMFYDATRANNARSMLFYVTAG